MAAPALAASTMKAVQYFAYGGGPEGLKYVDIPVPVPKKGEMLVKVEAASVNPVDWKISDGIMKIISLPKFPYIPGTDIGGEVVSVGPNVEDFATGDKVISYLEIKNGGSLAEYAVALPKLSTKRPDGVSAVDGACIPCAGITALQGLTNSGVNVDGSYTGNVLITAAAGGVGLYAVQLAKLSGAHVTVTVGERNIELLKSLGADEVLDYKSPEGTSLISPSGKKYDIVVNCTAAVKWSTIQPQLAPKGQVQELNPSAGTFASFIVKKLTFKKQRHSLLLMSASDRDLAFLADLVAEGKLKTFVDSKFPFDKAQEAWAKSKEGHATGKVVVAVVDE